MEGTKRLPVKVSLEFIDDLNNIYYFGVETFGIKQAEIYKSEIWKLIEGLSSNWPFF
jgi:hypothetical protein